MTRWRLYELKILARFFNVLITRWKISPTNAIDLFYVAQYYTGTYERMDTFLHFHYIRLYQHVIDVIGKYQRRLAQILPHLCLTKSAFYIPTTAILWCANAWHLQLRISCFHMDIRHDLLSQLTPSTIVLILDQFVTSLKGRSFIFHLQDIKKNILKIFVEHRFKNICAKKTSIPATKELQKTLFCYFARGVSRLSAA